MVSDAKVGGNEQRSTIQQGIVVASTVVLCAALLTPFGALPPFGTGYYSLVSASIQWLHFCAGLGALVLFVGLLIAPRVVLASLANPASLAICTFAPIARANRWTAGELGRRR